MRHLLALALCASLVHAAYEPLNDKNRPIAGEPALSPADSAAALKVPAGFRVEVIVGEPKIVQPIAYTIDDRGRLWIVECTNYPASPGQPPPADLPAKGPPSAPLAESYVSTLSVALRAQQKLNPFMLLH